MASHSLDLLIRGGQVVTPAGVRRADVGVSEGRIVEIAEAISTGAAETIDATGLHVFPGVIDPHVHFNEPGREDWEGVTTGSSALAAGGGTLFFDMPLNSTPPVLDGESFDRKLEVCRAKSYTDFAIWGGLTPANLDKMDELAERGVVGFKAFMSNSGIDDFGRADDLTLWRGMKKAAELGLIVAVHAESEELTSRLTAEARAAGKRGVRDYLSTRPVIAEVEAIGRAVAFAADTKCNLHIVHVSSPEGVFAAMLTGTEGWGVTHETCPHYYVLEENDLEQLGAKAKCAPPLRSREDVQAMQQILMNGEVHFVASDHSPAPQSMKEDGDFFNVWGGIAGVQSTLASLLTLEPPLKLRDVAGYTSTSAALRFGVAGKGAIDIGNDADVTLVDVAARYELSREMLLDRHRLSPYVGRTFRGQVSRTLLRGLTIFEQGRMVGLPGGRFVKPSTPPMILPFGWDRG